MEDAHTAHKQRKTNLDDGADIKNDYVVADGITGNHVYDQNKPKLNEQICP